MVPLRAFRRGVPLAIPCDSRASRQLPRPLRTVHFLNFRALAGGSPAGLAPAGLRGSSTSGDRRMRMACVGFVGIVNCRGESGRCEEQVLMCACVTFRRSRSRPPRLTAPAAAAQPASLRLAGPKPWGMSSEIRLVAARVPSPFAETSSRSRPAT